MKYSISLLIFVFCLGLPVLSFSSPSDNSASATIDCFLEFSAEVVEANEVHEFTQAEVCPEAPDITFCMLAADAALTVAINQAIVDFAICCAIYVSIMC